MFKFGKMREDEQRAASNKKAAQIQKDKDAARKARSTHSANLRVLRLAKEAEDKKAADIISAEKDAAKAKKAARSNAA